MWTSPRRARRTRYVLVVALALALFGSLAQSSSAGPQQTAPASSAAALKAPGARLRFELSTTSDWSSATFGPTAFYASKPVGGTAGVASSERSLRLDGASSGVVEGILPLPTDMNLDLRLQKGVIGTSTLTVRQYDAAGASKVVAQLVSSAKSGATNDATMSIPAATLRASAIELGATDPERLVIAAFYPWWTGSEAGYFSPDTPSGSWRTTKVAEISGQLAQMAGAGINTAALSMGWPQDDRRAMTAVVLDAAAQQSAVRLVPYVELELATSQGGWSADYLEHIISESVLTAKAMPNTFVFRSGRPVLFFYGDQNIPATLWNSVIARVEAKHGPIFAVTHSLDSGRRTDGVHSYLDLGTEGERWGATWRRTVVGRYQPMVDTVMPKRIVVSTVTPGLDTAAVWWVPRQAIARDGGAYYQRSWDIATAVQPDWVFVTSWNEWWEQTHIAPSTVNGTQALDITRARAATFQAP